MVDLQPRNTRRRIWTFTYFLQNKLESEIPNYPSQRWIEAVSLLSTNMDLVEISLQVPKPLS